jgi:hypothetical protein
VTPFGLMRETVLSPEVIEAAAQRLKRAGLLEVLVDAVMGWRGSSGLPPPWRKSNLRGSLGRGSRQCAPGRIRTCAPASGGR